MIIVIIIKIVNGYSPPAKLHAFFYIKKGGLFPNIFRHIVCGMDAAVLMFLWSENSVAIRRSRIASWGIAQDAERLERKGGHDGCFCMRENARKVSPLSLQ